MNIVVLDGYTLNPGDLSWSGLETLGGCTVYDRTPPEHIVARAGEAEIVLTNKTPLTAETLAVLPKLKYIGVLATGYNVVDVAAARDRGVPVTNIPTYGTRSAARVAGVPVVVFAGRVPINREVYAGRGIREARALQPPGMSREESMRRTAVLLRETARVWCLSK